MVLFLIVAKKQNNYKKSHKCDGLPAEGVVPLLVKPSVSVDDGITSDIVIKY